MSNYGLLVYPTESSNDISTQARSFFGERVV